MSYLACGPGCNCPCKHCHTARYAKERIGTKCIECGEILGFPDSNRYEHCECICKVSVSPEEIEARLGADYQ